MCACVCMYVCVYVCQHVCVSLVPLKELVFVPKLLNMKVSGWNEKIQKAEILFVVVFIDIPHMICRIS